VGILPSSCYHRVSNKELIIHNQTLADLVAQVRNVIVSLHNSQIFATFCSFSYWLVLYCGASEQSDADEQRQQLMVLCVALNALVDWQELVSAVVSVCIDLFSPGMPSKAQMAASQFALSLVRTVRPRFLGSLPVSVSLIVLISSQAVRYARFLEGFDGILAPLSPEMQRSLIVIVAESYLLPWHNVADPNQVDVFSFVCFILMCEGLGEPFSQL
jgi:hypothetical protein